MSPVEDSYQSPRAGLQQKGHIIYEDIRVFSFSQRLNRLRFSCYTLASFLILALVGALVAILLAAAELSGAAIAVFAVVLLASMVYYVSLLIRRLHDLDQSGWLWLLIFVPMLAVPIQILMPGSTTLVYAVTLFGPLFNLYLMAGAGSSGMNRFGTPNPPNGFLVQFFGGIFWLLITLSVLLNLAFLALSFFAPEMLQQVPGMDPAQAGDAEAVREAIRRALGQ